MSQSADDRGQSGQYECREEESHTILGEGGSLYIFLIQQI
jgi:hypothetical protein